MHETGAYMVIPKQLSEKGRISMTTCRIEGMTIGTTPDWWMVN
jgi:hypothetical protein